MAAQRLANQQPEVSGLVRLHHGKVRDMYDAGQGRMLMVASDRISAFDCILPVGIPSKGRVLTAISAFWFDLMSGVVPNHLISTDWSVIAATLGLDPRDSKLAGRSSLVRRAQRIDVECVVRGYLAGSGWAEYLELGSLAGVALPTCLRQCEQLAAATFTPAIKSDSGHDENISIEQLTAMLGQTRAKQLETTSLAVYEAARKYALGRGIIIADTKFEFGLIDDQLILIDELLTPDSSRFWPAKQYEPGRVQPSFDKQPVRDYLLASNWNRQPPAPALPQDVIAATEARYRAAFAMLTGRDLDD
jgi:phosphoribosylaminoimidazole-succinocarboxamide synthase